MRVPGWLEAEDEGFSLWGFRGSGTLGFFQGFRDVRVFWGVQGLGIVFFCFVFVVFRGLGDVRVF